MLRIHFHLIAFILSCLTFSAFAGPKIKFETSLGSIIIELNTQKAPITSSNFIRYVNQGYYDGLIFHRVIPHFMIQGGGFNTKMVQTKTDMPIKNEANNGLKNNRGTIAMARSSQPNSATSQFFINLANNDFLNYQSPEQYGYAVFGQVIKGMNIVDKIAHQKTGTFQRHKDVPLKPIYIIKAKVLPEHQSSNNKRDNVRTPTPVAPVAQSSPADLR